MANKKLMKEVVVEQKDINAIKIITAQESLMDTSKYSLKDKIAAISVINDSIATLTEHVEKLTAELENVPMEDICNELIKNKDILAGETPVFAVVDRTGTIKKFEVVSSTKTGAFNMDEFKKYAEDPANYAALPDSYKKASLQGVPFFRGLYKAGALGTYEKYFTKEEDKTITKLKKVAEAKK